MPEASARGGQGIEKSVVGRRPSCCLQDAWRWDRRARPLLQNALDRRPSCCLQDSASAAFGHGVAAAGDSVPLAEGGSGGIASNSRGEPRATSAHSPGRPAGKGSRKRPGAGDNCAGVASGTQAGCKRVAGDDRGQAERLADNKDSGNHSSGSSRSECDGIILFGTTPKLQSPPEKSPHIETAIEFLTASPPMGLLLMKPARVLLSYTGPNTHDAHRSP